MDKIGLKRQFERIVAIHIAGGILINIAKQQHCSNSQTNIYIPALSEKIIYIKSI